ncbi:MAG TPA: hypothetical protein VFH02_12155 [Jiangellaceae bacterium]|jgi:hypothetical protein|nr:hypothetical protein [Jiangellaceae bacterium]
MTRGAPRSTPPDGPEPRVGGDRTDDDIAAMDDASTDPTLAAGHGAPGPLVVITRIAMVGLVVGVAVLLLFEATDAIRSLRRRTSHQLAERWAGIERRERREARRVVFGEVAALAARVTRRPD